MVKGLKPTQECFNPAGLAQRAIRNVKQASVQPLSYTRNLKQSLDTSCKAFPDVASLSWFAVAMRDARQC